jgi:hypothetical protein
MEHIDESILKKSYSSKEWWVNRRRKYNRGMAIACITAMVCYTILGSYLLAPYFNMLIVFALFTQGIGFIILLGIANLFYNLGHWADKNFNKYNSEKFRQRLFNSGFWVSCALAFLIPAWAILGFLAELTR